MNKKKLPITITSLIACLCSLFLMITAARADEIDNLAESIMQQRNIPGMQLAVIKDGKIIKTASYGLANIQDNIPVQNHSVFPINSMTKLFTGVAIVQLAEQGKLNFDDSIVTHLPELPKAWQAITIRQVLSHTSGLPNILYGDTIQLIADNQPEAAWQLVQTLPLQFPANSQFSYNQTGYVILGKIIDKLAKKPFTDFITEQQLQPANMAISKAAGFGHLQSVIANQARQYRYNRAGDLYVIQAAFAPYLRTAAGLNSTAQELAHYLIALQQGKLFKQKESLAALWQPTVLNNGKTAGFNRLENGYALGWQVIDRKHHPAISASGGNANTLIIYPEDDLAIVVLTNLVGSLPIQFVDEIAGTFFPEMKAENGWGYSLAIQKLLQKLQKHGFEHAIASAKHLKNEEKLSFNVDEINAWGYHFVGKNQLTKALEIFKLNVHLFPQVANCYDSLAETYAALGDKHAAIRNYKKVLTLAPNNRHAQHQLASLTLAN